MKTLKFRFSPTLIRSVLAHPGLKTGQDPSNDGRPVYEIEVFDDQPEVFDDSQSWRDTIAARFQSDDYSYNSLGAESGVSPAIVCRFIKGERDITVATAEKLCRALDLVLVRKEQVTPQRIQGAQDN